ncbi:MAG: hypothetical protein HY445_00980 [Candidatus Niyogibacteria bacterium]|nr:hypothetical protein [Candidatus Niyogibacteria bacterium]
MKLNVQKSEEGIISLITILAVGLFALGTVLTISAGTLSETVKNKNMTSGSQSFYTAESAMREGAYQVIEEVKEFGGDPTYAGEDYFALNSTSNSDVTVLYDWPYAIMRGEATGGNVNRAVIHTITVFPEGLAFDYAMYAQHKLNFGGNSTVNGNIFANDGIDFTGNSAEINGDAFSSEEFTDTDNINGEAISGVDPIPSPELDTDDYYDAATHIFADDNDAETFLNNKTNTARVFIEDLGEIKIQGNNTILNGFLATLGDLDITGGVINADENFAAIVVLGNLKISGGTIINGVVYVKGNTTFGAGTNVINGSLISAGDVSVTAVTGNATINYDPNIASAFPNLAGLNTTSTEDPKILGWTEE